ncbi:MAG: GspH/FimT family pseudopilin [Sulfuriferula sp.]
MMLILVPGRSRTRNIVPVTVKKATGFTLIEMLVVLVIMGILVGLVSVVAQPDDSARLRVEVERLAQLMDIATTESRQTGKSIAWTADSSGYRFWQLTENSGWQVLVGDDLLRARTLPQGMTIANLRVENMRAPNAMRLEFNAYGSVPVFSVDMSLGAARYTIVNSPVGDISISPEG